jgi:polysaccharide deacetylase 2 family uncharacterized protein YibQ
MTERPAARSTGGRPGNSAGRLLLLVAGFIVLLLGAAILTPYGRDLLFGARVRRAAVDRQGPPGELIRLFDEALKRELAAAGVDSSLVLTERAVRSGAAGDGPVTRARWEVPLPRTVEVGRGAELFAALVERFHGKRLPTPAGNERRLLLAAALRPDVEVELLYLGSDRARSDRPRIALLVDDFGYRNLAESEVLLPIGRGLTVAIHPNATGARDLADHCREKGLEVVINMPMEDPNYPRENPGDGAVLVDMSEEEIRQRLADAYDKLGGADGVTTFMGNLAIEDRVVMRAVLEEVRARRGYFLDTTRSTFSTVNELAAELGIPAQRLRPNQIDAEGTAAPVIRANLERLEATARERGLAVGMIRPYPATLEVLRTLLPRWTASGLEVVPLSEVVAVPSAAGASSR